MVIRVLTGRIKPGHEARLGVIAREALPALRAQDGIVAAHFGRQANPEGVDITFVTVWRSTADLYAWAGPDLTRPAALGGHDDILVQHQVRHYEAMDHEIADW